MQLKGKSYFFPLNPPDPHLKGLELSAKISGTTHVLYPKQDSGKCINIISLHNYSWVSYSLCLGWSDFWLPERYRSSQWHTSESHSQWDRFGPQRWVIFICWLITISSQRSQESWFLILFLFIFLSITSTPQVHMPRNWSTSWLPSQLPRRAALALLHPHPFSPRPGELRAKNLDCREP